MDKTIASQRLTYFTLLWAQVAFMEQMVHYRGWLFIPSDQVFIVAIILAISFPSTLAALAFLVIAGLIHVFFSSTNLLNNLVFETLINFTILTVIGLSFVNRKTWGLENKDIYSKPCPLLRIFLLIFYFFSFFIKLNTDFLDPNVSCAVSAMDQFFRFWFGAHQMLWLKPIDIGGTLITEFSLPLMLIFKRTRNIAIIIGLCFHLFLGFMARVWGFSMLMGMLYFVFLPEQSFYLIENWGEKFKNIFEKVMPGAISRILVVLMLVYVSLLYFSSFNTFNLFCFWLALYSLMMIVFILSIFLSRHQGPTVMDANEGSYFLPRPAWLLVLVLPLL